MSKLRNQIIQANQEHKLKFMASKDLFQPEDYTQIFSAKTGKYVGTISHGQEIPFEEQVEELLQPQEQPNKDQLSLF